MVALDDVWERWDGHGVPGARGGERLPLVARIVHLAEQAAWQYLTAGREAAVAEVRRRGGGHLDPDLVARFVAEAEPVLAALDTPDLLAAVLAAEPAPVAVVDPDQLAQLCRALAIVVDLKGRYLVGHSGHVAALADRAAELAGSTAPERAQLRAAALLHDLGRAGVSSAVWDRPGPLGAADWERVRLHAYWTGRVLGAARVWLRWPRRRPPTTSGWTAGATTSPRPVSCRPGPGCWPRPTCSPRSPRTARTGRPRTADQAAGVLIGEVLAGRLDRDAAGAVIEAAGLPRPRADWPCGLTEREVQVLRLAARGLSNRQIADELVLSDRTVETHLTHVYDKTGRRTRAGAAVFAMEHDLLIADIR